VTGYDADAFAAFEEAGWTTKEADAYDALAGRVTAPVAEPLLDAVGAGPGTRLLDVATGPGYVASRAAARGADAKGLDFSETMLAFARARSPDVEFVHGDATDLPFEDASFDAVTAAFVLLHLGRPEEAVVEAFRVLAPGGRAAFAVWDEPASNRWLGVVFDAFAAGGGVPLSSVPAGPPIFQFADPATFTTLLGQAGFTEVAVDTVGFALRIETEDELWDGLAEGSVRMRHLMVGQDDVVQLAIRERFDRLLEKYRSEEGFDVPVSVKLAAGTKA
jgi:SAM-dependent methyltransferase